MNDPMTDMAGQAFSPLIGVAPLLRRAFAKQDMQALGMALLKRAEEHIDDAHALMDCSVYLQITGHHDLALAMQAQAIKTQPLYHFPATQDGPGLRLLVIMGPGDLMANTPIEFLLEESDVSFDILYLTRDAAWPDIVPEHDVMMVAMAESESNQALLAQLAQLTATWPRPVINLPQYIAKLTRDGVCATLADCAGIDMPRTVRAKRATLLSLAANELTLSQLLPGDDFPLIIRPLGSHAGTNLDKVDDRAQLAGYLSRVDAADFYLSRFVDYRSADGWFRKYRIALIEGRPFLCHMAVSKHWMIHYLNAGMNEDGNKREQEALCMAQFDEDFAVTHAAALKLIDQRMGLPYIGIDCAVSASGDLLIFEVDNAMVVHAMDPLDMYEYKQAVMKKLFRAFRAMLGNASRQPAPNTIAIQ
ncbi:MULTISPECIES: RimK family alpha-L-glutamate ligase [unclassified Undibacterium]|uniref:ATP-grasp domain-containing protein n=2 Tax=Bacteria TaxID=2 RepID=UPI002AC946A4|nr:MULTISPECIES: RimK family alpha-L-glutamate ligase [unclassified Undibacterium]MEB0137884.1 RimK family alpha-L-glutamate ligase [Undibacterium sp. CCC2.1]MEB0174120.1 RimK family alpha-L-glutamate ligase [Undibacterium sp. CCC1.1]MEB0174892.1 RimK family alpha-L-glutamate ligase [Undibacterium sp. CCC3.4]MEB0214900.1 RimK family alpha-L-glutamate ligase [Undibacterium sp. 5I2]WPX45342.1 RimK family alpha-L-glutamate ligase [Undibacterium sp. CCC3.4]